MVDKMVFGIVIAHDDGKGVVTRDCHKGTADGYGLPGVQIAEKIEDVFYACKAKSYADGIDYAIEMFVEIGVPAEYEPKGKQFETFFGNGCDEEGFEGCAQQGVRTSCTKQNVLNDVFNENNGYGDKYSVEHSLDELSQRFGSCVFLPNIEEQDEDGEQSCEEYQ